MPDLNVDPDKLPRDWREVVKAGSFLIATFGGVAAVALLVGQPTARQVETVDHRVSVMESSLKEHAMDGSPKARLDDLDRRVRALETNQRVISNALNWQNEVLSTIGVKLGVALPPRPLLLPASGVDP